MHAAQYFHPIKMNPSLIETHYNRGRPMSDLALHAAQYFRPRKLNLPHIQNQHHQYHHGQPMSGSKRRAVEIADEAHGATVGSTSPKKNAPGPDTFDTRPTKRQRVSTAAPATAPITLSPSAEAMLARQALKAKPMIFRRTRPVRARSSATAAAENKAKAVGGAAAADIEGAIKGMNKEDGDTAPVPLEMSAKEPPSQMRRAAEAPTKGPTTSFASPPTYRK